MVRRSKATRTEIPARMVPAQSVKRPPHTCGCGRAGSACTLLCRQGVVSSFGARWMEREYLRVMGRDLSCCSLYLSTTRTASLSLFPPVVFFLSAAIITRPSTFWISIRPLTLRPTPSPSCLLPCPPRTSLLLCLPSLPAGCCWYGCVSGWGAPQNHNTETPSQKLYRNRGDRYASLFFVACIDQDDNELITLEKIHLFVEVLDRYFGNVCELDIIFNFHKAYYILDELFIGGELQVGGGGRSARCGVVFDG